jgi:toxin ParE1/3/4
MLFEVVLTADAVGDLEEIGDWMTKHDSPAKAGHVLERIEETVLGLARYPERGAHPRELLDLGIREYRETFFKPYRIVYRTIGRRVYIYLIADGRRDFRTLLARRILGA